MKPLWLSLDDHHRPTDDPARAQIYRDHDMYTLWSVQPLRTSDEKGTVFHLPLDVLRAEDVIVAVLRRRSRELLGLQDIGYGECVQVELCEDAWKVIA